MGMWDCSQLPWLNELESQKLQNCSLGITELEKKLWRIWWLSVSLRVCFPSKLYSVQFSRSVVSDSAIPWIAAHQASLSITNSRSSLRLTSIESVMPSSHLILCHPLLLLPPISPSIKVFSNESTLRMRWPEYWSFSFSIIPSKETIFMNRIQLKIPFRCFQILLGRIFMELTYVSHNVWIWTTFYIVY